MPSPSPHGPSGQRDERRQVPGAAMAGHDRAEVGRIDLRRRGAAAPVSAIEPASRCPASKLTFERTSANRSLRAASCGTSSVKRRPGVLVGIVANGPRNSAGAGAWGRRGPRGSGPPQSQTSRIDRARPVPWPRPRRPAPSPAAPPRRSGGTRDASGPDTSAPGTGRSRSSRAPRPGFEPDHRHAVSNPPSVISLPVAFNDRPIRAPASGSRIESS